MSRALLLRHGESAHNVHTGRETLADAEGDRLTERGIEQAQGAGTGLAVHGVTRLWTSPMRRAVETAGAIGTALDRWRRGSASAGCSGRGIRRDSTGGG